MINFERREFKKSICVIKGIADEKDLYHGFFQAYWRRHKKVLTELEKEMKNMGNKYYFEDFKIGMEFETGGKTITEADIVNFAALSGDWNLIHVDAEFAKNTIFGRRVAHGLLTLSIASGLITRLRLTEKTIIAFYGIDDLRFTKPVFIGDTIKVVAKVVDKKDKGEYGVVAYDIKVLKQTGEVVLVYEAKLAVKKKAS